MLNQVERCREYAARHGYRLIVDTVGCSASSLPLPFGRVFRLKDCGCVALTSLSPQEQSRLNRMTAHPARFEGLLHTTVTRDLVSINFDAPPCAPLMIHMTLGGGLKSARLIRSRQLSVNPAFLASHAKRWQKVVSGISGLGDYDAVHIRHTDHKTPDYAALLERVFSSPAVTCALVCSDNPSVLTEAAQIAAVHGKRMVTTASLEQPQGGAPSLRPEPFTLLPQPVAPPRSEAGGPASEARPAGGPASEARPAAPTPAPLHMQARRMKHDQAEAYVLDLLRDLYALSRAARIHLAAVEAKPRPAGFSLLAAYLQSHPAERDAFFGSHA
jgi:hypothetical protein